MRTFKVGFGEEGECGEHGCGGQATPRVNRETGERFWGCSNFPRGCRNTETDREHHRRMDNARVLETIGHEHFH